MIRKMSYTFPPIVAVVLVDTIHNVRQCCGRISNLRVTGWAAINAEEASALEIFHRLIFFQRMSGPGFRCIASLFGHSLFILSDVISFKLHFSFHHHWWAKFLRIYTEQYLSHSEIKFNQIKFWSNFKWSLLTSMDQCICMKTGGEIYIWNIL